MESEMAPGTEDVAPPGVDEPAPPGLEEDEVEAPPGVELEKMDTKSQTPTAPTETDGTAPVSSEALAYAGYPSYGAYDASTGYGYDPTYWNYYSAGGYYPSAYTASASAGRVSASLDMVVGHPVI
jgi:hypothetical protein